MAKSLIIVESPAKARTIRKYLGASFIVKASLGHVKDLPKSKMGVSLENNFTPEYKIIPGKQKIVNELKKAANQTHSVFLALDPDREGEAIAWHIAEELGIEGDRIRRVLFNEITKKGIRLGLDNPLPLNGRRYESQQARRILDRLVGYEISPILWKKVRRGLSAGRVQSVALRLIVDRDDEILAFEPREYWQIYAQFEGSDPPPFKARYWGTDGAKREVENEAQASEIRSDLEEAEFRVAKVERKERRRAAPPPFITSRLQQEAARRFRFTAKRTMVVAQQLYEGIDIGEQGTVGLITYMRTDSVRLADDAVEEARAFIQDRFGKSYLPAKANVFKSRKSAQDAHEAIRPTGVANEPKQLSKFLTPDQRKLYRLIWERFIACQMKASRHEQTTVHIAAGRHNLKATGSVLKFRGWLEVYADAQIAPVNGGDNGKDEETAELPPTETGMVLELIGGQVNCDQKFTQPPPRFNEGTLIRELEERGIGRPSTYATIISTIQSRRYVTKDEGRFQPSELGRLVTRRLIRHFPRILNVDFTASMEESLDKIEEGKEDWIKLLKQFYVHFHEDVQKALKEMKNVRDLAETTEELCDLCQKPMVIKWGRNGRFLACSGYPKCRNTKEISDDSGNPAEAPPVDLKCEECGSPMVRKTGRYGGFLACTGYPKCKVTRSLPTGIDCPQPGCKGELVERRTRRGRVFFGCSEYKATNCSFVVWGTPAKEPCPNCDAAFLVVTNRRKGGRELKCVTEGCGYKRSES